MGAQQRTDILIQHGFDPAFHIALPPCAGSVRDVGNGLGQLLFPRQIPLPGYHNALCLG